MTSRHFFRCLVLAGALQVLALSSAIGQDNGASDTSSALTSEEDLSLVDEDISSLTDEQKLERGEEKVNQMREIVDGVAEMLEEVRDNERDILKINCINENHAAVKGFVKVSEQSFSNLQGATDNGDTRSADHHYTLISVAHQKVQNLSEEAYLCTGEERRFAGETDIEFVSPDSGDEQIDSPDDGTLSMDLPDLTPSR